MQQQSEGATESVSIARRLLAAYAEFQESFRMLTRRAPDRFARGDWQGMRADVRERLDAYPTTVARTVEALVPEEIDDATLVAWQHAKLEYAEAVAGEVDEELAQTFFSSVSRRIFCVVGQKPTVEFTSGLRFSEQAPLSDGVYRSYPTVEYEPAAWVLNMMRQHMGATDFADLNADCAVAGQGIVAALEAAGWAEPASGTPVERIEVLTPAFYRSKAAYVIGRMVRGNEVMPLVIALRHRAGGVFIDAVLTDEASVSVLFSFTRSYFHADAFNYRETIRFLKTLIPDKPVAELYDALGHNKHGKTSQYRHLQRHLGRTIDRFEFARGKPGMVMLVFTLPSYEVVFKVIKDRFDQPKRTTRQHVKGRYRLVFQHDRAGRLIGAQEYEQLEFDVDRFQPALLDALLRDAASTVTRVGNHVVFRHLYIERRITPLDVFLQEAGPEAASEALLDYGRAIKDLATTNIFPGDIFLKNFGVTRHGRVVFYDYDELCFLTDCNFRRIPEPRTPEQEMASEPWYYVAPGDVFPEEFPTFLALPPALRPAFMAEHGDLFDAEFWQRMQEQHVCGALPDVFPYHARQRL